MPSQVSAVPAWMRPTGQLEGLYIFYRALNTCHHPLNTCHHALNTYHHAVQVTLRERDDHEKNTCTHRRVRCKLWPDCQEMIPLIFKARHEESHWGGTKWHYQAEMTHCDNCERDPYQYASFDSPGVKSSCENSLSPHRELNKN